MPKKNKKSPSSKPKKPKSSKVGAYKSFRISKKIKPNKPIDGAITIFRRAFGTIMDSKPLFLGFAFLYAVFNIIFSLLSDSRIDIASLKSQTEELLGGEVSQTSLNFALYGDLLGSTGPNTTDAIGVYRSIFSIVLSLAVIWALRRVIAGDKAAIKESFYKGMYPIIPFFLVLLVIGLQLIPFLFANLVFAAVFGTGIAVTVLEKILWIVIVVLISLLSIYMLLSSVFAAYIVTLPDMTPMKALRSARALVLHRRVAVAIRLIFLLVVLSILVTAFVVPIIFAWPVAAEAVLYLVSGFSLVLTHSYIYNLYRSLL